MFNWVNGNLKGNLAVGQGERGKSLEFLWEGTSLGVRVEGDAEYQFTSLGVEGVDGREIELQVADEYIQWRYTGEQSWENLIALNSLKGKDGIIGKDGKSAYEIAVENGFVGTQEEWLESLRGQNGADGQQGAQGEKGDSGVFVGDISEAPESAEIIVDDSDLGLTYISEELIDNTTLSTNKTWSSSKIEDFVLNNDNTVWLDQSGESLKIDNTKEGYLREVEIWGNTIQNEEDLSDIQHLGELYVDDEGQPILDDLGREQYKIEIESYNQNLNEIDNSLVMPFAYNTDGSVATSGNDLHYEKYIKIRPNSRIFLSFGENTYVRVIGYDKNKNFTRTITRSHIKFDFLSESNEEYVRISWNPVYSRTVDELYISLDNYTDISHKSHKTTILLPCQLMKVGDIADRLFWDNEKGKYIIEKIITEKLVATRTSKIEDVTSTDELSGTGKYMCFLVNGFPSGSLEFVPNPFGKFFKWFESGFRPYDGECINSVSVGFRIKILKSRLETEDVNGFKKWLDEVGGFKVERYKELQLIDTNITEQIKLPTYLNTAYVTVNGGINGSIKAKAPVDGSVVVNSLVQANYELKQENKEIKAINEEQDEVINMSLMATDEIFMMLEPLLDIATLSNENTTSKIADMYRVMVNKGLKNIEDVPQRYRVELTKDGE